MSLSQKVVFLCLTLTGARAGGGPTNIIGINNIIDIPNKISGITGFGPKNNGTSGDGTTTVMGTNYGSIIPDVSHQIFGANKTGSDKGNSTSSGNGSSTGSNYGSIITSIPNQVFGPNKTGPVQFPDFGSMVSGLPDKVFGNNKTNTDNGTASGSNLWPDFGSMMSGLPDKVFGNNKTNSDNGTASGSNLWPDFGSMISGLPDKVFGNNKTSSGNKTEAETSTGFPNFGPISPDNIFGNKKNCSGTSSNSIIPDPTGVIPDFSGIMPGYSHGAHGKNQTDSKNSTSGEDSDHKPREKRCSHCGDKMMNHQEHDKEKDTELEHSRRLRQTSIASALGSGGTGLGALGPGGTGLGALGSGGSGLGSLGSSLGSGEATLVMGMFQVLVKPIKGLPGMDGLTDAIKNPQSILTQPQTLLGGGKN